MGSVESHEVGDVTQFLALPTLYSLAGYIVIYGDILQYQEIYVVEVAGHCYIAILVERHFGYISRQYKHDANKDACQMFLHLVYDGSSQPTGILLPLSQLW